MKNGINRVFKRIKFLFIPYLILLAACLVIKVVYTKPQIYFTFNSWHFALGDEFFPSWTNMGDGLTIIVVTLCMLLYSYRNAFLLGSSYAITSIVAQIIKHIANSPRPVLYFKGQVSKMYLIKGVEMLELNSFPSGHTVSAFSAAVVLTYLTPRKFWGLIFLIYAVSVGYSRMYLSEHFFEDVVAGSVIGVLVTVMWVYYVDARAFIHTPKWNRGLLDRLKT